VPSYLVRQLATSGEAYYWFPSTERLFSNLRMRALISVALTFGIPGTLAIALAPRLPQIGRSVGAEVLLPLLTGIAFTFLLVFYSVWTAYADGRFMWPATIFSLPLALWMIARLRHADATDRAS
jgi:hypothetical protein